MTTYWQSWITILMGIGIGTIGMSTQASAGSTNSVFNFKAIFVGGSCDISAPANIEFNNGNAFSSAEIAQKNAATNESFNLTLSNCAGWGLTPVIKVSGSKTSDFGEALFRNTGGSLDANGYGILLGTPGNTTFSHNLNLAANDLILVKNNWSTETQLNSVDMTIPMVASLRCGDCNYPGRQGGKFSASVTFDFAYE